MLHQHMVFSALLSSPLNGAMHYGHLSVVTNDYIAFWKDKYYVNMSWSSRQEPNQADGDPRLAHQCRKSRQQGITRICSPIPGAGCGKKSSFPSGNLALSNFYYFDYKDIFKIAGGHCLFPRRSSQDRHPVHLISNKALEVLASAKQYYNQQTVHRCGDGFPGIQLQG